MTSNDLRGRAQASSQRTDKPANGDQPGTGVATQQKPATLMDFVVAFKDEIAQALPRQISADRMVRIVITALRRDANLRNCTKESFLGALMTAAQLGLEVNTPAGEAYLIAYKQECTLVLGYQGIVKLFWQHPQAKHIDAQAVYDGDDFDYAYGLDPFLKHKPAPDGRRGDRVTHYYAVATLQGGGSAFVVLSPDQVKALRQGKVGPKGDIADPMLWMERKTALKQMLKLLPKTVELQAALVADENVRTDWSTPLDTLEARPPVIDVAPEPRQDEAAAQGPAEQLQAGPEPTGDQPSAAQDEGAAQPAPVEDACPACGEVPSHSPADCPMAAELADSATLDESEGQQQ